MFWIWETRLALQGWISIHLRDAHSYNRRWHFYGIADRKQNYCDSKLSEEPQVGRRGERLPDDMEHSVAESESISQ